MTQLYEASVGPWKLISQLQQVLANRTLHSVCVEHELTEEWAQGPGLCRGQRQQELMGKEIEGRRKRDEQVHGTLKVAL